MAHALATCCFCGVGCGIYLETSGDRIVGAYPSMSHPANRGRICVRGWHVHEVASSPDRLKAPLLRKKGALVEVSWDEAYGFIAERLRAIRDRHGPDAIGFVSSTHCSNEESYLLQKLARSVIGTNNVDHGISVHRTNTIQALSEMLGVPAATCSIADIERSDVIVVDGVDLAKGSPTIGGWVLRARLRGAKVIVVGARHSRIAVNADMFLQNRPRTEIHLYGAMAKIIVDRGLMDMKFIKARCRGYEEFLARVKEYDVLWAAEQCDVPPESIEEAALAFARAGIVIRDCDAEL
ncbi:MAG: hypothetical protein A2V77_04235 [Anaeromyxobacter sp. RBG_16_69_14]|nr:MAG: hypothetical protein A2V77_04235 [Anaeromyxobacter sp. RBG_16_69_14]